MNHIAKDNNWIVIFDVAASNRHASYICVPAEYLGSVICDCKHIGHMWLAGYMARPPTGGINLSDVAS